MYKISCHTIQLNTTKSVYDMLEEMKTAGFDTYDFTMCDYKKCCDQFIDKRDYISRARKLRKFADKLGLKCNQTHSPFPIVHPSFSKEHIKNEFKMLVRSLKVSAILGADYCVVHPLNDYDDEYNAAYFSKILPFCHKFGIKIAIENMWNWDNEKNQARTASCSNHNNFVHLLDLINDDYAWAIVDIGHAEMKGLSTSAVEMIKALGSRVKCLHIHDNDKHYDLHSFPGEGLIDFHAVIKALKEVNYTGDFTFEVIRNFKLCQDNNYVPLYEKILDCGNKFKEEFFSLSTY